MLLRDHGVCFYRVLMIVLVSQQPQQAQDGIRWAIVSQSGIAPTPRRGVAGTYDADARRLVFQGGETAERRFLPDVWYFDVDTRKWTERTEAGAPARCHHTLVGDAARGRALLFGGFPRSNELWTWDAASGAWSDATPADSPAPRCLHSSLVCDARGEMIIYGGLNGDMMPDLEDTWSYDLASGVWSRVAERSPPGQRYGHVVALDVAAGRMILFGGYRRIDDDDSAANVGDLWELDLESREWSELTPSTPGPSARQFASGGTLADGSGMVVVGGLTDDSYLNDVWMLAFEDLSWRRIDPDPSILPAPRFRHTVVMDPERNRFWMAFGECADSEHYNEVWMLDLEALTVPSVLLRRGDLNEDGLRNVSDAIVVLDELFRGRPTIVCLDAADTDDSGRLDLADPVMLLNHLFASGVAPQPPFEACAEDPTDDDLDCASFPECG